MIALLLFGAVALLLVAAATAPIAALARLDETPHVACYGSNELNVLRSRCACPADSGTLVS